MFSANSRFKALGFICLEFILEEFGGEFLTFYSVPKLLRAGCVVVLQKKQDGK